MPFFIFSKILFISIIKGKTGFTPIILDTREVAVGGLQSKAHPGTSTRPYLKNQKQRDWESGSSGRALA
jgi:hypothetical protein